MKPPFNPWPLGVVLAFLVFIAGTASLVLIACAQRSDLVRPDYYAHEVRHQQHMDKVTHTLATAPDTGVTYEAQQDSILLSLPEAHARHAPQGEIHLYRPSAANLDRYFTLDLDASGQQRLDARELSPGLWYVQISWSVGQEDYFYSQKLVMNHN